MKWEKTTIGRHCTVTSSKRFHLSDRSDTGIPFYCSKEIIQKVNGQNIIECDYIKEEAYEEVKRKFGVPEFGDLLITTRGTYGVPYIYKSDDKFYFADGNLTWLKDFDEYMSVEFLYYWILSYEGQKKIDAIAKGTAQKAVPITAIKDIELYIPDINAQRRIASILSTYDCLIENNQKQIKLLEEAAQRLYKEWFVDMRFPGWEDTKIVDGVPEGWRKETLQNIISYEIGGGWGEEEITEDYEKEAFVIRGTDLFGITHGEYLSIPFRYHKESNLSSRKLKAHDIVFEVSGGSKTEGVARTALITQAMLDNWKKDVICASFCKLVRTTKDNALLLFNHFVYLRNSGKTIEYDKRSASSIVNYRWKDFLSQENIIIPDELTLKKYNDFANSIYSKIVNCSIQSEKLKQARDRLLPKLMSGELEV